MNNFAVSTDGLAVALQDSASALMTANNSYEQAAAMVAAANKVVQNPSEVGGALRTISLRLRGTKVSELERMGEDTTGAVETQSKLRSKLKGLTGVDILTDTGAYKSTYDILLEISKVWDGLTDENRAGALELIAGKNRANVASALLSNTKDLEAAYETAMSAEGSALAENEKYLDSIQGKIDQFNNALQTMWNNTLDDEVVKKFVDFGTTLIELVDNIGLVRLAFMGLGTYISKKFFNGKLSTPFASMFDKKNLNKELKELEQHYANALDRKKGYTGTDPKTISKYDDGIKRAKKNLEDFKKSHADIGTKGASAWNKITTGAKSFLKQLGSVAKEMLAMYAVIQMIDLAGKVIEGIVNWFDGRQKTAEEAHTEFEELNSELNNAKSELSSLEGELDTVQGQIDELMSRGTLTFADKEQLNLLQKQSSELERQIELTETLEKSLQKGVNAKAMNAYDLYTTDTSFYSKETREDRKAAGKEKGSTWGSLIGMGIGLGLSFIPGLQGVGALALMGGGSLAGSWVGSAVGGSISDASYSSEKTVREILDNMEIERKRLEKAEEKAHETYVDDPSNKNEEKWLASSQALADYDANLAGHMQRLQEYYNSIDPSTLEPEELDDYRKMGNDLDKYNIEMGTVGSTKVALDRIFSDEQITDEAKRLKGAIQEAVESGEDIGFTDFDGKEFEEIRKQLNDLGIPMVSVIDYFRELEEAAKDASYYDSYDSVKNIAELTSGVSQLKDALNEYGEAGIVSTGTLISLNETFSASGDAWSNYVDGVASGSASFEEAIELTEQLAENHLNLMMKDGPFNLDNAEGYLAYLTAINQLEQLGVKNAKEYVDALQQDAMMKKIVGDMDTDTERIKELSGSNNLNADEQTELHKLKSKKPEDYITEVEQSSGTTLEDVSLVYMKEKAEKAKRYADEMNELENYVNEAVTDMGKHIIDRDKYFSTAKDYLNKIEDMEAKGYGVKAGDDTENPVATWDEYKSALGEVVDTVGIGLVDIETNYDVYDQLLEDYDTAFDSGLEEKDKMQKIFDRLVKKANEYGLDFDEDKIKRFTTSAGDVESQEIFQELTNLIKEYVDSEDWDQIAKDLEAEYQDAMDDIGLDLTLEFESHEDIMTALAESASGTGLTRGSMAKIIGRYYWLDESDFDGIFEKSANGIKVNSYKLVNLEQSYAARESAELQKKLQTQCDLYEELGEKIKETTDPMAQLNYISKQDALRGQIENTAILIAQYKGLTSAYQGWVEAQSGPEEGDRYDSITSNLENVKELYEQELIGTNEFREAVQFMSSEPISHAISDPEQLVEMYEEAMPKMQRYFTEGREGAQRFLQDVEALNMGFAEYNAETREWTFDFDIDKVAEELGISVEAVEALLGKLGDYGFKIDMEDLFSDLDGAKDYISEVIESLNILDENGEKINIDIKATDMDVLQEDIDAVSTHLKGLQDGTIIPVDNSELQNTQVVLAQLLWQKHQVETESHLKITTTTDDTGISHVMYLLDQLETKQVYKEIALQVGQKETAAALQGEIDGILAELQGQEIPAELGIDKAQSAENIAAAWSAFKADTEASGEILVKLGVDDEKIINYNPSEEGGDKTATVTYYYNDEKVREYTPPPKTGTVYYNAKMTGDGIARGTAFFSGTAFARGNWGTKNSGVALGGELGQELVVRDGRFFTIGDNGAEFFHYKKDDIIFNAEQTRQIFEKGKITTGNRRGKALAEGTAFAEGTALKSGTAVSGSGGFREDKNKKKPASTPSSSSNSSNSSSSSTNNNKSSNESSSDDKTELEKIQEWFDHKIDEFDHRIATNEKNINLLEAQDLEVSADYYNDMIASENEKIYQNELRLAELNAELANHSEYSEEWYNVRDAINATKEAIQDSKVAIVEYGNAIDELPLDKLEKNQELYDNYLSGPKHLGASLEKDVARLEALGEGVSSDYYKELIKNEETSLGLYKQQRNELIQLLATIPEGTEEWYGVRQAIYDVDEAIQESTTKAIGYGTSITEGYVEAVSDIGDSYDNFDNLKDDQISSLEKYGDLLDVRGELPSKELYETMNKHHQEKIDGDTAEFNHLVKVLQGVQKELNPYTEGTAEWEAFEKNRAKAIITIREQMRGLKLSSQDSLLEIEKNKEAWKDTVAEAWDNVRESYKNKDQYYENQKALAESYGDRLDILDINVPDGVYKEQIRVQREQNENLKNNFLSARKELIELEKEVGADDPRYIQKYFEATKLYQQWYDGENEVLKQEQEMLDNRLDKFNQIIDRINHSVNELQNISDLMERDDVATEDGEWTAEGLTQLGMAYQQMEYNKQIVEEYSEEMKELEKLYNQGKISEKKYTEQLQELEDGQWDAINAYEDTKDVIIDLNEARIDMIEDGIDKEIESYEELINLKKEELEAERDLYGFRKNVQSQTKVISSLERRIASMSGSTDAATIAERTRLEAQLREVKANLDDTYYGHALDSQNKALDDEMEAYEKSNKDYLEGLRESIKDTEVLIEQTYNDLVINSGVVLEKLTEITDIYGIEIDSNLTKPWESAESEALNFNLVASQHIADIGFKVKKEKSVLSEDLSAPWEAQTSIGGPIYAYSDYAKKQIDATIDHAKQQQDDLQSALYDGFKDPGTPLGLVDQYESDATGAIQAVINKAVEASAAISQTSADLDNLLSGYDQINKNSKPKPIETKNTNSGSTTQNNNSNTSGSSEDGKYGATVNGVQSASPYSGKWNNNVGNLQVVLVEAFGYPVGKKNGQYSYVPDGLWGSITAASVKKMQKTIGANQTGKYDSQTYDKLSAWLTNKYNNDSDTNRWQRALTYMPKAFAKGTMGTKKDEWAITDEIGDELVMYATPEGRLSYMRAGSTVVPHDLTKELINIGEIGLDGLKAMPQFNSGVNLMSNYISKPEINLTFDALVKAERIDEGTLPEVKKFVQQEINSLVKQMNYAIKGRGGR